MSNDEIEPWVSLLVKKLLNLLREDARFFDPVREQVDEMESKLWTMRSFLIDAERKQNEGDVNVSGLMVEITELLYSAEEVFASSLVGVTPDDRTRCHPVLCFDWKRSSSDYFGTQIQQINNGIASVTSRLQIHGVQQSTAAAATTTETAPRITYSTVVEEDVVGFQDHVTTVVAHLKDKTHPGIIVIWGTAGIGKTTFSKEILRHIEVKRYFDHIAWVCVSQECHPYQIFRDILFQFADKSEEEKKMITQLPSNELSGRLSDFQVQKRCLVILDDMWKAEDWFSLCHAFPSVARDSDSKIVITTRQKEVLGSNHDFPFFFYELQPLTEKEGLVLLAKKAWPERQGYKMSTEMNEVMKEIVRRCRGLPLAIVLIGGLLSKDKTLEGWEKVLQDVSKSLNKGNEGIQNVLSLSYLDLPCHLKACFLYLSLFPEDCEIEAKALVQMWIAEGFVSAPRGRRNRSTTLSVGLGYLNELVNRSMVQANIARFTRRVRSCHLHDVMRDFCMSKARDENFSEDLHLGHSRPRAPTLVNVIRRLSVYLDGNQQRRVSIIPLQRFQHVLSCLVHPSGDYANLSLDMVNSLLKGFRFLVFNLEHSGSTDHGKLSEDIGKLVHLRYLKLALSSLRLPASLGNLIFLQTLDLRGIECSIPDVLWKLVELRHLYLPRYYSRYPSKLYLGGLSKLETLVNFRTDFCHIGSLQTLSKLRKVSIGCRVDELATIFGLPTFREVNSYLFRFNLNIDGAATEEEHGILSEVLASSCLFKLTLNGLLYEETNFLDSLSSWITSITLTGCQLMEDPMPVLGKMPNLRKLNLRRGSYIGEKMVCIAPNNETEVTSSAGGFPQLTLLWLKGLDISEWEVEEGTMPCLSTLGIYSCNQLREIPDGLKYITTLERLIVADLKPSFERRILPGGSDFYKVEHIPFIKIAD